MMKQAIILHLKKNNQIEKIRKLYTPNYSKFKPHITLVHPFEVSSQDLLASHIKNSIDGTRSFNLTLNGLKESAKEFYLYLLVDEGKSDIIKLYQRLNSGILSRFKNKDMPVYIPHLTLGVFKSKEEMEEAIKQIKTPLKFKMKIKSIELITLNKDFSINKSKYFKLN